MVIWRTAAGPQGFALVGLVGVRWFLDSVKRVLAAGDRRSSRGETMRFALLAVCNGSSNGCGLSGRGDGFGVILRHLIPDLCRLASDRRPCVFV